MFKKILVPLDGSSLAEKALPVAEEEAKAHGASIVLLRVVHPNFFDKPFSKAEKTLIEKYKEQANKYLAIVAERVRNEAAGDRVEARRAGPLPRDEAGPLPWSTKGQPPVPLHRPRG